MINIFVDESGDLGQRDDYFVIALVELKNPKRIKNFIKKFCAEKNIEEVHATCLSFPDRQLLVNKLNNIPDYTVSYIIADKGKISSQKLFESNNLLFNYLFAFLVEDTFKANNDDVSILLDNRTQKVASVNSLSDYIKIKAHTDWGFTRNLNIRYIDSKACKAVQIADLVANSVRRKYVYGKSDVYSRLKIVKSIKFPYLNFRYNIFSYTQTVDKS